MKLFEIIKAIEEKFPPECAYEWDNVGLLVGDKCRDIKKAVVTLDVTEETVNAAIDLGADLIVSHHPVIFSGINKITKDTSLGRTLILAIENKISIYSAHTNCDVAKDGINAYLAELFELLDVEELEETGLGRIGNLKEEIALEEFAEVVKKKLNTPFVRVGGDIKNKVKRVAIGSGAGSGSIPFAIRKGADVMLTGDTKYHDVLNYTQEDISVIDAGHYPTEIVVTDIFARIISECGIEVEKYCASDVYRYI